MKTNIKKVVAFGASSSTKSINRTFALYAASQITDVEIVALDLNAFEMPIYSQDRQNESGIPQLALDFLQLIGESDGVIISLAEHNGAYSTAFKNILDWASRAREKMDVWQGKPMLILATSPGERGGASVYGLAESFFPYLSAKIIGGIKLPSYYENFDVKNGGITNNALNDEFQGLITRFQSALG
jgi:chromate reductase, NAD(P)H dehydrogenase (quinone)